MNETVNSTLYDIQIKSPMGWIKVKADLTEDSDTAFHDEVRLMGITVPMTDCEKCGQRYRFKASPRLPFGVLEVAIEAEVHADGSVTGTANAPRHKPMDIRGQRAAE